MAFSWSIFTVLKLWFLVSSLMLCYVLGTLDNNLLPDCNQEPSPRHRTYEIRDQVFISTLDGQLTSLDLSEGGRMLWSHSTGHGGLFSSSMSKLKVTSKGQVFRLVPSLDGTLYRFNGQNLERLPMNADTLLRSSFGLAEDTVITGGKESLVYGINLSTGEVRYSSAMQGSVSEGGSVDNSEDILVVQKVSHTVRAVELRSGEERWNFSVGEHFLSLREGLGSDCIQSGKRTTVDPLDCPDCRSKDYVFQVDPKEGYIGATHQKNLVWNHKFDSPIVHAWHLREGRLEPLDLFQHHLVVEQEVSGSSACRKVPAPADMYFGIHEEEYYIQHSASLRDKLLQGQAVSILGKGPLPSIKFKPYLLSGESRTPHVNIGKQTPALIEDRSKEDLATAVVLKQDYLDYPFDAGFYLHSNTQLKGVSLENETVCGPDEEVLIDLDDDDEEETFIIITSLWHWWKEVLFISIFTSVIVNLSVTPIILKRMKRKLLAQTFMQSSASVQLSQSGSGSNKASDPPPDSPSTDPPSADSGIGNELPPFDHSYNSRYLTDFEPIRRLGKGGFGVVFEARNIIDDCHYAVKRISLPNREEAREKVMREVKALAKLDHPGIVRYFNAWQECPPPGWQEHLDQQWDASGHPSITSPSTQASPSQFSKTETSPSNVSAFRFFKNPLKPFDWASSKNKSLAQKPPSSDESGSYSYEKNRLAVGDTNESSFEIVFQGSVDGEGSFREMIRKTPSVDGDTLSHGSVLGEDSGCGDHSHVTEGSGDARPNRPSKLELPNTSQLAERVRMVPTPSTLYLYIQMQLCMKETLKDWLVSNTFRERERILDIFDQIVSAVQYVHDCNLMHRDLKPSNIFFSFDGTVKVGDFGLVTALSESEAHTPSQADSTAGKEEVYSKHTNQVGTHLYMSPEQMAGQPYSHKVDVYSLGLIFFELLVSFPTQMERIKVITNLKNHSFPIDFKQGSQDECAFVERLLSRDPSERPSVLDIKQHPLLTPFQLRPVYRRPRTLSHRFSSSGSECEPGSPAPDEDCAVVNSVTASS